MKALILISLAGVGTAAQAVITIDFEGLASMPFPFGSPIPPTARLDNQFRAINGASFSSGAGYVAVVNLGAGHATSGVNGIGGSTPSGNLTYTQANPITVHFFDPTSTSVQAVTDFVAFRMDRISNSGQNVTLQAFDINGGLLDTDTVMDTAGGALLVTTGPPLIHSVRFLGTTTEGNAVALDDLQFNPVTAVPEPTTIAALAAGGLLLMRRRRK